MSENKENKAEWEAEFVDKFCPYNGEHRIKCLCSKACFHNEECEYRELMLFIKDLLEQERKKVAGEILKEMVWLKDRDKNKVFKDIQTEIKQFIGAIETKYGLER